MVLKWSQIDCWGMADWTSKFHFFYCLSKPLAATIHTVYSAGLSLYVMVHVYCHYTHSLQGQVDEVVCVMKDNVGKVMMRGERLDDLHDKSGLYTLDIPIRKCFVTCFNQFYSCSRKNMPSCIHVCCIHGSLDLHLKLQQFVSWRHVTPVCFRKSIVKCWHV